MLKNIIVRIKNINISYTLLITIASQDPKYNTNVQRTWTNYKESAIKAVESLKIDNTKTLVLPPIDNELSLTLKSNKVYLHR
jgi:hypothetical protein